MQFHIQAEKQNLDVDEELHADDLPSIYMIGFFFFKRYVGKLHLQRKSGVLLGLPRLHYSLDVIDSADLPNCLTSIGSITRRWIFMNRLHVFIRKFSQPEPKISFVLL
jgi:hypothetical protein